MATVTRVYELLRQTVNTMAARRELPGTVAPAALLARARPAQSWPRSFAKQLIMVVSGSLILLGGRCVSWAWLTARCVVRGLLTVPGGG
jgi:hypothetical protein